MKKLDALEAQLRALIEDRLPKVLPGGKAAAAQLTRQLAAAMHGSLKTQPDGRALAANLYVLVAHPGTLSRWRGRPGFLEALLSTLLAAGAEAGLRFASSPSLTTAADLTLKPGKARVLASFSSEGLAETRGMPVKKAKGIDSGTIPENAFLIIQGTKIFPLKQSVVNIGRRLDNHVVIDDPRVSRSHAQLRAARGHFMLFDLNSTGGTFVNNARITQSALYPGDLISLAGVVLIFGQDAPLRQAAGLDLAETAASPVVSEMSTIIIPEAQDKSQ
jgi:hypothetical protein